MWFVSILRCASGLLYVGETHDLRARLMNHNDGRAQFIAKHRPVQMVYAEEHPNRSAALERERQLKGWTRAKKEALIAGDAELLKSS